MLDKLTWKPFSEVNLTDDFFDSLRLDYDNEKFDNWFMGKAKKGERALTLIENDRVYAFLYLKLEDEPIQLVERTLPAKPRLKIGTLKLEDSISQQRLGEGVIGVALWKWQESKRDTIYVTAFEKQKRLIGLLLKFGFENIGTKENGEIVLARSRKKIDYSSAYSSFPFLSPYTNKGGIIPINDAFHDRLFPYSETYYRSHEIEEVTAGNGVTKVYIGCPYTTTHYAVGDVVGIYRKYTGEESKGNRSAITSFCTITKITTVKDNGKIMIGEGEYLRQAGNKTVFTQKELITIYHNNKNVVMIEMLYNGFFPKGRNVTYWQLKNNGLFEDHPYNICYSIDQVKKILELGGSDVKNIIIN